MKNLLTCMGNWLAWVTQRTIQKILYRDFLDRMKPHLTSGQVPGEVVAFFPPCPLTPTISFLLFPQPPTSLILPASPFTLTIFFSHFLVFFLSLFIFFIFLCYYYFILKKNCYLFFAMFSFFVCFCVCSSCVCVEEKLYHNKTLLGHIMFF